MADPVSDASRESPGHPGPWTGQAAGDHSFRAPLGSLMTRELVSCRPETSLKEALGRMNALGVGSMLVCDDRGAPLGIFTLRDLLGRVVLPGTPLDSPIAAVMTPDPQGLPPQATASDAALLMARHRMGHVCLVENGRAVGMVSERNLFALQRVSLATLSRALHEAPDLDSLVRLGPEVARLIGQMLAQGAEVEQITRIVSTLNDHLTRRVLELCLAGEGPLPPFTWLAFGSEGRMEQTLKTDQDNGILFQAEPGAATQEARARLLPFAQRVNQALDACGFTLCLGGVMAGNPECCLSAAEWQARFARWMDQGTPEHLLNASIYFDLRPLYGDPAPAQDLRRWLLDYAAPRPRFLRQLTANALLNRPPLGVIRDFTVARDGDHPGTLDLKLNGLTPFTDAARILSLAARVDATNTPARLRGVAAAGLVREGEAAAWCEAYGFIQLQRLRHHQRLARETKALNNYVNPDDLHELDRRILRESCRQARKLQALLGLDYLR